MMDVRNGLQETFVARMEAARPAGALIVSLGGGGGPGGGGGGGGGEGGGGERGEGGRGGGGEAEVWCKAWAAYAGMVAVEEKALARGLASPHRWTAWFARIAKGVVVSEKRREAVVRRALGVRVWEMVGGEGEDGWGGLDTVAA